MKSITNLSEFKTIELNIMKKIHYFCIKNNIQYYLSYGSLLGAVRHSGFIPWDDDIDIYMPRQDYERFLRLFPHYGIIHDLEVVNNTTKKYYGRAMSKVIDTNTVLIEPEYKYDDEIGVFVDIWPLDGLSNNAKKRKKEITKLKIMKFLLYKKIIKLQFEKGIVNKVISIFCFLFVNNKRIINKTNDYLKKIDYQKSEYIVDISNPKFLLKREWFDDKKLVKFEDCEFFIPIGYEKILNACYGDWKKLPPLDQQNPNHNVEAWYK